MQTEQQQLRRMVSRSVLPQVLLLHGKDQEKGKSLLTWLLQLLFCQQDVCGKCAACQQITAGGHADTLYFTEEGKFGVKEASRLQEFIQVCSYAAARVVVIFAAQRMTTQAANKLLKTLEEPNNGYVFLLSNQKNALLPTVRSRCFQFLITSTADANVPYRQEVESILTATDMNKATAVAKGLGKKGCDVHGFLQALEMYLHAEYNRQTVAQTVRVRVRRRHLHNLKRLTRQQTNLNLQLCVESLLGQVHE